MTKTKKKPRTPAKSRSPYYELDARDQQAVDMKVDHYNMRVIAGFMGQSYETIRDNFARGGRLYEAFIYRRRELQEEYRESRKKVEKIFAEGAIDAAITLRNAARRQGMTGVVAARDVLDRAGFKPPEQVKHTNDPDNPLPETVTIYIPANGRETEQLEDKGNK